MVWVNWNLVFIQIVLYTNKKDFFRAYFTNAGNSSNINRRKYILVNSGQSENEIHALVS